jgi:hypothetical protein
MKTVALVAVLVLSACLVAWQQLTVPTTGPSTNPTSRPSLVLEPVKETTTTKPSETVNLRYAEGTYLIDQIGKLTHDKADDAKFAFEADGKTIELGVMPNTNLARMEEALAAGKNVRFKITAVATQYREKNYILIERVEALSK